MLFLDLVVVSHTHKPLHCLKHSKSVQQYDFSLCNPKSTKMCNCVGAKRTICHHGSWRQSQQDRRCEVASRKAGHCFWAAHRPLISWHSDVNSCPQDVCLPTGRDDKCPPSPFVCTFWHWSIKILIEQLPFSTSPLNMLLQIHACSYVFYSTRTHHQGNKSKSSWHTINCRLVAD